MWLNDKQINSAAICAHRASLLNTTPNHIVIDHLFNEAKLDEVVRILQQPHHWKTQKHTYSSLYVDSAQWQKTADDERFVQRDAWQCEASSPATAMAHEFLSYLRGDEFMSFLSRLFKVTLTDITVAKPEINTTYFRLGATDFIAQHADDSPGREVCMLLYLNKEWQEGAGGELVFMGKNNKPTRIPPTYNRCVLFDPFSKGSEHWVEKLNAQYTDKYRYNVTSWYWSV